MLNNYKKLDKRKLFVSNLSLESDNLVIANQIHSKNVSIINRSGVYENTDGLCSVYNTYLTKENESLSIDLYDLLYDLIIISDIISTKYIK